MEKGVLGTAAIPAVGGLTLSAEMAAAAMANNNPRLSVTTGRKQARYIKLWRLLKASYPGVPSHTPQTRLQLQQSHEPDLMHHMLVQPQDLRDTCTLKARLGRTPARRDVTYFSCTSAASTSLH